MLWRGLEAFQEATALLAAAEAAAAAAGAPAARAAGIRQPFAWRHGMLRPARSAKQASDIARFLQADPGAAAATRAEAVTDAAALAALVPGLQPRQLMPDEQAEPAPAAGAAAGRKQRREQQHRQQLQQEQQAAGRPALGLMVQGGATVHPASYMAALWLACEQAAAQAGAGVTATLSRQAVPSLARLQAAAGPFDAVVVAAGAAIGSIDELRGVLPLELCHGYSLDMRPGGSGSWARSDEGGSNEGGSEHRGTSYPAGAPSLLGSPYLAAHGGDSLVVGATKRYGLSAAEAFEQCSRPLEGDPAAAAAAAGALLPAAAQLWPPLGGWRVEAVRAGVRALPTRGADGSIPYAGRLPLGLAGTEQQQEEQGKQVCQQQQPSCWVIGGLGARGLVYHAWLGRLVAAAVLAGSEGGLPRELLRWKQQAAGDG